MTEAGTGHFPAFSNMPIVACSYCPVFVITSDVVCLQHTPQLLVVSSSLPSCGMAPTKAKGKKGKRGNVPVSLTKIAKTAGNKSWVSATTILCWT